MIINKRNCRQNRHIILSRRNYRQNCYIITGKRNYRQICYIITRKRNYRQISYIITTVSKIHFRQICNITINWRAVGFPIEWFSINEIGVHVVERSECGWVCGCMRAHVCVWEFACELPAWYFTNVSFNLFLCLYFTHYSTFIA